MLDIAKLYWALLALGRSDDARRLRRDSIAARGGEPAAVQRLEETTEELKWALGALGSSEEARRIREAAIAARAPGPDVQPRLARTGPPPPPPEPAPSGPLLEPVAVVPPDPARLPVEDEVHQPVPDQPSAKAIPPVPEAPPAPADAAPPVAATPARDGSDAIPASPAAVPHAADAGAAPPVSATAARGDSDAITSLRRRLAALDGQTAKRRARLTWGRRERVALVAAALLGGTAVVATLAVAHREALAGGWAAARAQIAGTWQLASARLSRGVEASGPTEAERRTSGAPAAVRAPASRARGKAHATPSGSERSGRAGAPAAGAASVPEPASSPRHVPVARGPAADAPAAVPEPGASPRDPAPRIDPGAVRSLWRAETWQMTVDDVLREFPGATPVAASAPDPDGLAARATVGGLVVAGHPWTARFRFDPSGRIAEIQLFPAEPGAGAGLARDHLAEALAAGYGAPGADGAGGGARATWSTADGVAELQAARPEPGPSRVLFLDMKAGDVRPVPEREPTLTIRPPRYPGP